MNELDPIHLGAPIHGVSVYAAAYGKENGEERIYAVSTGNPCVLHIVDPVKGICIRRLEVEGSNHSWGTVVSTDGRVYIGGDGYLYQYTPGEEEIVNLGVAIEGETYFWRLAAGTNGQVFGGTYPGGKVFSYDPETDQFKSFGHIVDGQKYVRSLAFSSPYLYIGLGSQSAQLIRLNIDTCEKKEIPFPETVTNQSFVYDANVADSFLFVRVTPSNQLLIYDLEKEEWVDQIDSTDGLDVSTPDSEGYVYFVKDGILHSYHLSSLTLKKTDAKIDDFAMGFGWMTIKGRTLLASAKRNGDFWLYDPITEEFQIVAVELQGQPISIQSLVQGPDGNLYIGGYLVGGFAKFDYRENQFTEYPGVGQIEGMVTHKAKIYMGVYTKAKIFEYEPSRPWVDGENPRLLFSLNHLKQDRPFALVSAGEKVAIGTVPDYGVLGGALTLYDPMTEEYEAYVNIIPNQSIIVLAYQNGIIYGGTSIWGGLGKEPTEQEAKLFAWDPERKQLLWETTPIPGEKAISALYFDETGMLWGLSGGYLFQYDIEQKHSTRKIQIIDYDWKQATHFYRGGTLFLDNDGMLVGSLFGKLFRFNRTTGDWEILHDKAILNQRDRDGNIYFAHETNLYQYKV